MTDENKCLMCKWQPERNGGLPCPQDKRLETYMKGASGGGGSGGKGCVIVCGDYESYYPASMFATPLNFTPVEQPTFDERVSNIAQEVTDLLSKKNADYGDQNLLRHGLRGILIRMDDKLARLANIADKGGEVTTETVEDTLKDIAGYAIQAIRLRREGKI